VRLFTIGFTKKTAEQFFETLRRSGTERIIDVRLNNVSQLAGFAKKSDLAYFLEKICGIEYVHLPILAPTQDLLDAYRKERSGWPAYEERFLALMRERQIENAVSRQVVADGCLLCSEDKPHHCHRRLVAEYLDRHWGGIDIRHLE
jgi:uncharacterized protein (DUF488 family)